MRDPDDIADEIDAQNRRTLEYGRHRFLWTWLALALLAILTSVSLILAANTAKSQTDTVEMTANTANETANTAAATNEEITRYLKGEQGIPGVPGANGKDGSPGLPSSSAGPKGATGASGPAGSAGPPGPTGSASSVPGPLGPAGSTGLTGAAGIDGPAGPAGEPGKQGDVGPIGARGEKGDPGAKGDTGATGAVGPPGPAGTTTTQVVTNTSPMDIDLIKDLVATCPTGTTITGGGYRWVPTSELITDVASFPQGNGWFIEVHATSAFAALGASWEATVFAVCAG